jgi:superfamily I DNA/RNA helicase
MRLTDEQELIVYCDDDVILVSARAGTGKTTTLSAFVKARKAYRFAYIPYNTITKDEAIGKFPESTFISTIHSIAYQVCGKQYQNKLVHSLTIEDIAKLPYFFALDLHDKQVVSLANHVIRLITDYCNSDKPKLDSFSDIPLLVQLAKEYWAEMINPNNDFSITHDTYLKLYQLINPVLDYDYILIDEAQDSNAAMLDIILKQKAKKIFVGDPHQRIYGFRGAINVFDLVEGTQFYLTESFRFGPQIANIANLLLQLKDEDILLKGSEFRESIVGPLDKTMQYTVITRTNAALIDLAIENVIDNKKVFINGGEKILGSIIDVTHLYHGRYDQIKNNNMRTMKNYAHFKTMSKITKNPEAMLQVYLIDKYGASLSEWVDVLKRNLSGKKSADIILTTAHKSKGLEFVSVLIADDFGDITANSSSEDINILYVAVTRATHDLELSYSLKKLLY